MPFPLFWTKHDLNVLIFLCDLTVSVVICETMVKEAKRPLNDFHVFGGFGLVRTLNGGCVRSLLDDVGVVFPFF